MIHLATAAVVNAVWDLWAKVEGKPLWKLLVDLSPEELVRASTSATSPTPSRRRRRSTCSATLSGRAWRARPRSCATAIPAYTTSAGWLGYPDDKIRAALREAIAAGLTHFKIKVGATSPDDRRAALIREEIGPDRKLMMDANQVWDVDEAIAWMRTLAAFDALVDRGADEPGRRARPRRDPARDRTRSASRPASTARTASSSSSSCRRGRSTSARSTPAGSAA